MVTIKINEVVTLEHAELSKNYRDQFRIPKSSDDFYYLYINGEKKSDTLYRIGGMNPLSNPDYFLILKHEEGTYDSFVEKDIPHLVPTWCIYDKNGILKLTFSQYESIYLTGGLIYSIKNKFYNIETGFYYGNTTRYLKTDNYLFLENKYLPIDGIKGVMKIHIPTGEYEIIN